MVFAFAGIRSIWYLSFFTIRRPLEMKNGFEGEKKKEFEEGKKKAFEEEKKKAFEEENKNGF